MCIRDRPEVAVPTLIAVVESKVIFPLASKSNVEESISIGTSWAVPINIPVPASTLILPPASISILLAPLPLIVIWLLASISKVVESISIGLSVVVPMFIPVSESILKVPEEDIAVVLSPFIVIAPLASISNVDDSTLNGLSTVSYTHLTLPTIYSV